MRLVCVISSISSGGAERVMSELANTYTRRGWSVRLVTVAGTEQDFYRLNPEIDRVALTQSGVSKNIFVALTRNWRRIRLLRRAVTSFDPNAVLVFGARTNVLTLIALKWAGVPVVVSERTDPFALHLGFPWQQLRPRCYRNAAKVVAQTRLVAKNMAASWSLSNLEVIPNPLARSLPALGQLSGERSNVLLSVGRLSREKGHDILLDAWAGVQEDFPNWRLRIVGDGPEHQNLKDQATRLAVSGRIEFAGQVSPIWTEYISAYAFVLPSRREGFPNALIEAMACGCVCIASDCSIGPVEILNYGALGKLYTPNRPESLRIAITTVLSNKSLQADLQIASTVRDQYAIEAIADQWTVILQEVAKT